MKKYTKILLVGFMLLSSLVSFFAFTKTFNKVNAAQDTSEFDTIIDTVSLSDLTWDGTTNHDGIYNHPSIVNATYTKTSENGSLILKFKYEVNNASGGDSNSFCIYTGVKTGDIWNDTDGNPFLLRQDGIYVMRYRDSSFSYKKYADGLLAGIHDIELGRIYLTSGDNQDKYYVYIKIDGTIIGETYNPYNRSQVDNRIFFHFSDGNTENVPYDINYTKGSYKSLYETPDIVSISNLKENSQYVGESLTLNNQTRYSYDSTNLHKSVIFTFKYKIDEIPSKQDFDYGQIHFYDGWSEYPIWLRNDHTYIKKDDSGYVQGLRPFSEAGLHDVEIGKLYIEVGENIGKYYLYAKADDVLLAEYVSSFDFSNANIFWTAKNGLQVYDINYDIEKYETPDEISISDLKNDGTLVGNQVKLLEQTSFTYDATSEHKSVIFKFKIKLDAIPEMTDYSYAQFHFSSTWSEHFIWMRNDRTYIKKDDSGYVAGKKAIAESGTKEIEIGKLYINSGTNAGKYYLYAKADSELLAGYTTSTTLNESSIFISVVNGIILYDIDYVEPTYEEAKVISLNDLKNESTPLIDKYEIQQNCFSYDNSDHTPNYSIVFKFIYKINSLEMNQIHVVRDELNFRWGTGSSFILCNDGTGQAYLGKSTVANNDLGWSQCSLESPLSIGNIYDIEYGRLAIMNGTNFTGKYHVYLKINGNIVNELDVEIDPNNANGNSVFITGTSNVIYDINYDFSNDPVDYETPDEISVNNLKNSSGKTNKTITLDENKTYSYDATKTNYSFIFKFKYEVTAINKDNSKDELSCQFHFSNGWGNSSDCFIWFRDDKNRIYKGDEIRYLESDPFSELGLYNPSLPVKF